MASILVVGGAGYIGSHCCKALAAEGYVPVVYDDLSTGHRDFVKWGPLVEADVRDQRRIEATLRQYKPIAVMHFAALALVGESVRMPGLYWGVNVGGTLALLEAMHVVGLDKLVFSSTCAVYGEPQVLPITESAAKVPVNPYGASKLAAERMMDDFDAAYGLRSVRLRYFNAAGADPDGTLGEDHEPETHLIPLVLDAAMGRREAIAVFGNDYPTADGSAVRDYVHVADLATAHVRALRYLIDGGSAVGLNLGTGEGASVLEVAATAERVVGHRIPQTMHPRRPGDPARLVADAHFARSLLGWEPKRSELETALADAWRWHRARFGRPIETAAG